MTGRLQPGDVVAERFVIDRYVTSGGMGDVYRALDRFTDGQAAVKVVHAGDAGALERFAREARVLADLRHPGIVSYLAHGRSEGGAMYLAMEWLEGEDLSTRLHGAELTVAETLSVATAAAAALAVAHARDIVHRDVKPSNLFLADWKPERTKLLDFGVAKLARLAPLTATGLLVGTPLYMPPEQLRGGRVDARADVFALGAVLYRCLTGRMPFPASTTAELLARLADPDEAPPVTELAPAIPAALAALCGRMLRKDAGARPADAAAVLAELVAFDATELRSRPARAAELGSAEERLICVVCVAAPAGAELAAQAALHGGRTEPAPGATLVFFEGELAVDQARQAARFALACRAPAAVAMGRSRARVAERAAARVQLPAAVDEVVAGLLGARFDLGGDTGGLVLRGERTGEQPRLLLGRDTSFVGRDRELAMLESLFDDCVEHGVARAVLVTAPPGTGKSRLRLELARRLRARGADLEELAGFGDPMRAGAPLSLLAEAIRRAAAIDDAEEPAAQRDRLRAWVARSVPEAEGARVGEFLGELAGVPFDAAASMALRSARRDMGLLAEQIRQAWIDWLAAASERRPVVLVLEDLHWGDLPTVKLVGDALQALAERPLLVLGLARPEVHAVFPGIWAERGLQEIHLGSLPRRAAERMVGEALAGATPEVVAAIVERAAGNAFYLEELIRHVAEGRPGAFPESVLAMAESRFRDLPADARRVMRAASVYGEVFWSGGVAALLGADAAPALADLTARELVQRRRQSRFAGDDELGFRHGLLREAAYALLTDEDRRVGHRLAAAWLEQAGERDARVLAEHWERGGEPARAAAHYKQAAEQALAGADPDAALALVARGLASAPAEETAGELRLVEAMIHKVRGDVRGSLEAGRAAMAQLPPGGERWYAAAAEAASSAGKLNQIGELTGLIDRLLEGRPISPGQATGLARAAGQALICGVEALGARALEPLVPLPDHLRDEPLLSSWIEEALAFQAVFSRGDALAGLAHTEAAARLAAAAGDHRTACLQGIHAAFQVSVYGEHERAERWLRELAIEAERLRMPIAVRSAHLYRSLVLQQLDRLDEALALVAPMSRDPGAAAHPRVVCLILVVHADCVRRLGREEEAEPLIERAVALGETATPNIVYAYAHLAIIRARQGRLDEALALLPRMDLATRALRDPWAGPLCFDAHIQVLRAAGRLDDARAVAAQARTMLDDLARRLADPERVRGALSSSPIRGLQATIGRLSEP